MESSICKHARIAVGERDEELGARKVSMQCELKVHGGPEKEVIEKQEEGWSADIREDHGPMFCNIKVVEAHACPCFEARPCC